MSESTTFPGQQDSPVPMLKTETGWATAFGPQVLGRWARAGEDAVPTALQWDAAVSVSSGFQGIVGGRYILGGIVSGSTPKWGEFDPESGALLAQGDFGDKTTRWGAFTDTHRGLAGLLYADPLAGPFPVNEVWFDAFHRTNLQLTLPPGTNPPTGYPWWFQRFKFPTTMGTVALRMYMSAVQGSDGKIRAYVTRDSGNAVGEAVLRVGSLGLAMDSWNERFIGAGEGEMSPSGEFPNITAAVDPYNDRILLAYQNQPHRNHPVLLGIPPDPLITSRWAITEVKYDGSKRVLGVTPWWSTHREHCRPVLAPRPDGIWFALQDTEDSGAQNWKVGRFTEARGFEVMTTLPYGSVLSYTPDGWLLFLNRVTVETELLQMQFGPKLSIVRDGSNVIIDWKPFIPGDMLQERVEGGDWETPFVCVPPAVLPIESSSKIFRVVQGVPAS